VGIVLVLTEDKSRYFAVTVGTVAATKVVVVQVVVDYVVSVVSCRSLPSFVSFMARFILGLSVYLSDHLTTNPH
jgi:uncharacterized membrane protein